MFLSQLHKNPCRATFLLIDSPIDCLEICKILLAVLIQSQILSNLASIYNEANKDKISIFLSLLEPIFMLIVGTIIGFIVIAMLLPIFSMNLG